MTTPQAHIIKPSQGERYIKSRFARTDDIIGLCLDADIYDLHHLHDFAPSVKGADVKETCRNIFYFLVDNIQFKEDPDGEQWIVSPAYLYHRGYGDCKSYAKFVATCLRFHGIPYMYRFVAMDGSSNVHHVYIVAFDESGNEIAIDATPDNSAGKPTFGKEAYYNYKIDKEPLIPVGKAALNGRMGRSTVIPYQDIDESQAMAIFLHLSNKVNAGAAFQFLQKYNAAKEKKSAKMGIKFFPKLVENIAQKNINKRLDAFFKVDVEKMTPFFTYFFWPLSQNKDNFLPPEAATKLRRSLILFCATGLKYAAANYEETPRMLLPIFIGMRNYLDANIETNQSKSIQDKNMMSAFKEMWTKPFKDTLIFKDYVEAPVIQFAQDAFAKGENGVTILKLIRDLKQDGVPKFAPIDTIAFWGGKGLNINVDTGLDFNASSASAFGDKSDYDNNDSLVGMLRVGVKRILGKYPEDIVDDAFVQQFLVKSVKARNAWPQENVPGKLPKNKYAGLNLWLSGQELQHLKEKFPVGSDVFIDVPGWQTGPADSPVIFNGRHKVLHVGSTNDPKATNYLILDLPMPFFWDQNQWGYIDAIVSPTPPVDITTQSPGVSGQYGKKARVGELAVIVTIIAGVVAVLTAVWGLLKDIMGSVKNRKLMENLGPDTVPNPPADFGYCYIPTGGVNWVCRGDDGKWYEVTQDGTVLQQLDETELPPDPTGGGGGPQTTTRASFGPIAAILLIGAGAKILMKNNKKKPATRKRAAVRGLIDLHF